MGKGINKNNASLYILQYVDQQEQHLVIFFTVLVTGKDQVYTILKCMNYYTVRLNRTSVHRQNSVVWLF